MAKSRLTKTPPEDGKSSPHDVAFLIYRILVPAYVAGQLGTHKVSVAWDYESITITTPDQEFVIAVTEIIEGGADDGS